MKAAVKSRQNTLILKETQYQMIQKEKLISIGELAAGIAHEINNPIGFIGSNLETMQNFIKRIQQCVESYRELTELVSNNNASLDELKNKAKEVTELEWKLKLDFIVDDLGSIIDESISGIERVSKIVQSLNAFSRTAAENELTYNSLSSLMDDALMIVRNEAKYTILVETFYDEHQDAPCNKGQIVQVMVNLLLNAIHAIKTTHENQMGHITIKTYTENGFVCCSITDDGPGIPDSIKDKIFDPFFTTKDIGQGTGLGLSISLDIIAKKHNGELTYINEPAGGTTFIFKLPLHLNRKE
jgi:signal transduction histidine kinase